MPVEHRLVIVGLVPILIGGCGLVLDTDPSTDAASARADGGLPDGRIGADSAVAVDSAAEIRDTGIDGSPPPTDGGAPDVPVAPMVHYVFVTSGQVGADLGGLAGADATCESLADEAGLDGSFQAILSDGTRGARERLALTGPVELLDGTLVAANPSDLWDGSIAAPINLSEAGVSLSVGNVWTGTDADGDADRSAGFCNAWSSTSGGAEAGRIDRVDEGWISIYGFEGVSSHACRNTSHLYCILVG